MKEPFLINNRFLVNPGKNSFLDKETREEVQLEPRLVETLRQLAATPGQVVSRGQLWNDYGRSDEGLQQAILLLRRLLLDNTDSIIGHIPRKGYILHASVKKASAADNPENQKRKRILLMAGLVVMLIISIYFSYTLFTADSRPPEAPVPAASAGGTDTSYVSPDSAKK